MNRPDEPAPSRSDDAFDDDEIPRHPPIVPRDKGPIESLGEAIGDVVTGPAKDEPGDPAPSDDRPADRR